MGLGVPDSFLLAGRYNLADSAQSNWIGIVNRDNSIKHGMRPALLSLCVAPLRRGRGVYAQVCRELLLYAAAVLWMHFAALLADYGTQSLG